VTEEAAGTYTLGLWAVSKDGKDQVFKLAELQIGTAVREELASGPTATSKCFDCHAIPDSDKASMHHIHTDLSSTSGNWALDQYPVATCQACHNLDGYSVNTTVRKVHGLHRGRNQLAPGAAHAEYGMPEDTTLAEYGNVDFPAMPMGERDCATCHADDRWRTRPTRLGCGTCHDNLYFDTGTLVPPRAFGKPLGVSCTNDPSCSAFSILASCNLGNGICELASHPTQSNDSQCAVCHAESSILPVSANHEIFQQTRVRDLKLTEVVLSGGTGVGGSFLVGDTLTVGFKLTTGSSTIVSDLKTNSMLAGTAIVAGPTDDRQRIYQLTMKSQGTLTYDAGTQKYTYVFPSPWQANALVPYNTLNSAPRANPAGTYTLWMYVNESFSIPASFRDAANAIVDFRFGSDGPIQPRQVILKQACNACHTNMQAHGGGRQDEGGACSMCHTRDAEDRGVLSQGMSSCMQDSDCALSAYGSEVCYPKPVPTTLPILVSLPSPTGWNTCLVVYDPTPGQSIDMAVMGHQLHFARLLGGYASRNFAVSPGKLQYIGFNNTFIDMSENLLSVDVRNCKVCHRDSGTSCSPTTQCGVGQECIQSKCVNRSWTKPSTRVCLSCHDTEAAFGHAQLNTWVGVETCGVCHGESAQFSVERVHSTIVPYTPPYPRQ
jgi:hypothetical protein